MALNMTKKFTNSEVWVVGTGVAPSTAVLNSTTANGAPQPGVTLTGSGDYTKSQTYGPYTISGIPAGGVGNLSGQATVATNGAFRFAVTGASASTAKNAIVYAVTTGTAPNLVVTSLSTSGTTKFGKVDRYIGETGATECSVTIGIF